MEIPKKKKKKKKSRNGKSKLLELKVRGLRERRPRGTQIYICRCRFQRQTPSAGKKNVCHSAERGRVLIALIWLLTPCVNSQTRCTCTIGENGAHLLRRSLISLFKAALSNAAFEYICLCPPLGCCIHGVH